MLFSKMLFLDEAEHKGTAKVVEVDEDQKKKADDLY
jgi:hypothetical protein